MLHQNPLTRLSLTFHCSVILLLLFLILSLLDMKTKNHFVIVSLFRDKPVKTTLERHVFSIVQLETEEHLKYKVNVHYWDFICGFNVENLRSHPLFPFSPYRRDTTNDLFIRQTDVKFGARVFGYIHPNETGLFKFAISSDDCSEIWLSQDEDPLHVQLIGSVGRTTGEGLYQHTFAPSPFPLLNTHSSSIRTPFWFKIVFSNKITESIHSLYGIN